MKTFRGVIVGLLVGLACSVVGGQVSAPTKINIQDEGTSQGRVGQVNFVGAGVSAAVSGDVSTVTIAGSAGASATEIEIDFGAPGCGTTTVGDLNSPDHCETTITDAAVTTASKIKAWQAGTASTSGIGRDQDENDMDQFVCWTDPGTGTFLLFCRGLNGEVYGKFKVWYQVF